MEELCAACLCAKRKMVYIKETSVYYLYKQILNEVLIPEKMLESTQICWECNALLRKYEQFKQQAVLCYRELLLCLQEDPLNKHSIRKVPNIQTHEAYNITIPHVYSTEVKVEVKDEEVHCEPETFADDLIDVDVDGDADGDMEADLDVDVDLNVPKKVKKKSKKVKLSRKRKRKRVVNEEASGGEEEQGAGRGQGMKLESEDCGDAIKEEKAETKRGRSKEVLPDKPQCVECGKMFSSRKTYRYHINVLHKGQNKHPCPRCGKVYHWKSNLGRHMRSHKAREDGELYCAKCDKSFASIATYRQHLKLSKQHVTESDFSFSCDHCGKKFVNKTRLRDHIDWEHLRKIKFRCELCDKPFKCHTSLYVHRQSVHSERDKRDNLCHVCGKSYHNAAKLKYHIVAMHTSETPFRCVHCGATFGWYSSLYRHVRDLHYKLPGKAKKSKKTKLVDAAPEPCDAQTAATYT